MELPPSMHNVYEPIVVVNNRLVINQKAMLPYITYRFEFLDTKMIAILVLNPDRVDVYQEMEE